VRRVSSKKFRPEFVEEFSEFFDVRVGWVEAALRARDDFETIHAWRVPSKQRAAKGSVERGADPVMSRVK
jgi:hypothetical protein